MGQDNIYMTTTEFAERIGVHPQTVRDWDKTGKLSPHHRTLGGKRRYSEEQIQEVIKLQQQTQSTAAPQSD